MAKMKQIENNSADSVPQKYPANTQMCGDNMHMYKIYANLQLEKAEYVVCFYSRSCYKVVCVILKCLCLQSTLACTEGVELL